MDVRCNRCGTDYEFDDTLISDRGTTVQCTNCGYQFKIYPEGKGSSAPERWRVKTASGKEHVYTSLRDLQRAIGEHKVGPRDLLSRGAEPPRPLGSIPELEPFFATTSAGPSRGLQSVPRTLHGVAPPPSGAPRPPATAGKTQAGLGGKPFVPTHHTTDPGGFASTLPAGQGATSKVFEQSSTQPRVLGATLPSATPAVPSVAFDSTSLAEPPTPPAREPYAPVATPGGTLRIERGAPSSFDSTMPAASPPRPAPRSGGTQPSPPAPVAPAAAPPPALPASHAEPARPAPVAPVVTAPVASAPLSAGPRSSPRSSPRHTPPVPAVMPRDRAPSYDDLGEPQETGRRATSRWIAGVVILAVAGLLAATVGHKYLARFSSAPKPAPSARDTRAAAFLAEGLRLLDDAQYDEAQVALVKAQALADRDPAVLAGLAQVETFRAETFWLKLRLLDPTATELVQSTERELADRVAKARKAVDAAFAVAPEDPTVIRARVNVLRIAGDEQKAREWIQPVAANPADPQNAYVLAALDLAEAAPAWSTVIDRLRAAAVSGKDVGRARATLIYALVRAGRVVEAGTELAKVENAERKHPLLPELKGFVARFSAPLDGGMDAAVDAAVTDAAPPAEVTAADGAPSVAGAAEPAGAAGDFRQRLRQASEAAGAGDLSRADQLYRSVLVQHPGNTEAMAGLADVARRRNDTATASKLYAEVLEANPSYLPALMATADQKWQAGDRKGAIALYRRVLEQAGPSTDYGQRAQSRIAQGDGGDSGASKPAAPASKPSPAPASTPAQAPPSKPEIDTSDLPGVTPP